MLDTKENWVDQLDSLCDLGKRLNVSVCDFGYP